MCYVMLSAATSARRDAGAGASKRTKQTSGFQTATKKLVRVPLLDPKSIKNGWVTGSKSFPVQVDAYRRVKELGQGAHGRVDLVEYKGKQYALKSADLYDTDAMRELSTWMSVQGVDCVKGIMPNLHVIFVQDRAVYLLMDLMPGMELMEMMLDALLADKHKKSICLLLIDTVKKLHKCGLTHLDIKPENMVVQASKEDVVVALVDYGGSCIKGEQCTLTGTTNYMSPLVLERYVNEVNWRENPPVEDWFAWAVNADIWSTALTCFVILSGSMPGTTNERYQWLGVQRGTTMEANRIGHFLNMQSKDKLLSDMDWLVKIISGSK